jgi:hypothetical protein
MHAGSELVEFDSARLLEIADVQKGSEPDLADDVSRI